METICLDDRFVLKQMSKMEIQSFVDLAPNYIVYLSGANRENRPTTLCKIVGAFRIVFKNAQTNAASKQDLLVMENLFYRRNVNRKFDLKGSERNRLVSATEAGLSDCVLLDENLIKSKLFSIRTVRRRLWVRLMHSFTWLNCSDLGEPVVRARPCAERTERGTEEWYSVPCLAAGHGLLAARWYRRWHQSAHRWHNR